MPEAKDSKDVKKAKTPEKRSESGSRQRINAKSKNGKRDPKAKEDIPVEPTNPFGTVENTGALSVSAAVGGMTLAQSLRPRQAQAVLAASPNKQTGLGSPSVASASLGASGAFLALEDENGRFDAFKMSNQGQQLARELQQQRQATRALRNELRAVQDQITALSQQVVANRQAVEEKHAQLTSASSGS